MVKCTRLDDLAANTQKTAVTNVFRVDPRNPDRTGAQREELVG